MIGQRVLLLNANFLPLTSVTVKKAMSLIEKDRVFDAYEDWEDGEEHIAYKLETVSGPYRIPSVLRLKRYVNVPQINAKWSKPGVLRRDNWTCGYCGKHEPAHPRQFTVDHIIPKVVGGKNTWGNTICSCLKCNRKKGGRTPHQAKMPMLWEPKTPRTNYLVVSGSIPKDWKLFLNLPNEPDN
jgi:hypothetical protein